MATNTRNSFVGDSSRGLDEELIELTTPPSYDAEVQSCGPNSTTMLASEDDVTDDETQSWNKELSPEAYNSFGPSSLTTFDVCVHDNVISTGSTNRLFSTPSSQAILSPVASSQVFDSPSQNSLYNAPLPTLHRSGSSSCIRQEDLPFSGQEAFLLRNYIENLSPWADACDPLHHFATVVPQRAVDIPLLLYAVLAFSAQVLNVQSRCENAEASTYYSKSLSLLIPILSDPSQTYDENVLAAVVILRLYEERDVMDEKCHLLGQSRLLNSMAKFSHCGGLGEAASWVSLRQDIYISMISKQPISIDLKIYEKSQSFEKKDDGSWANVMVYLFARVLALAFSPNNEHLHDEWQYLDRSIEEWNASKPKTFSPMSLHRPALSNDRTFREIWMLNSFHVVGIQYYYLAKIFLKAYRPSASVFGFGACRENRVIESSIAEYLGIILGLSFGNPLVQNVWFTTSHILSACGCYLRDARERRAAIEFLEMMEKKTGWTTSAIASSLQEEWTCLDNEA
ncbi:hypothetical protein V502_01122 [Pseudogymnoascus sp. VKM F-4520 (FW-2644)]|nr:hypothetical protein V502_01122 [Pseudogymnoascus sp. VKM F-4520 (FW-2644)]